MKIIIFLMVISFGLVSCGKPNIEHECSLNGLGKASCTFRNTGDAKGDICLDASVQRTHGVYEDYLYTVNDMSTYMRRASSCANRFDLGIVVEKSSPFASKDSSSPSMEKGCSEDEVHYLYLDDGVGSRISSSSTICSGIVESKDVVEREKDLSPFLFSLNSGKTAAISLTDFCKVDEDGSWYEGCGIGFTPTEVQ